MVKQLSSIRDIRPTAWRSTWRNLCARPSLQATRSHLSKVVRVCRAWLPRVVRGLRALPRRRVGRRREATSTAPAAGCPPSGRHWPALARLDSGTERAAANRELRFPSRTYLSRKPLASAPSRLRDNAVPDHEVRSRSRPAQHRRLPGLPPPDTHRTHPHAKGRLPNRPFTFTTEPPNSVNIHRNRAC